MPSWCRATWSPNSACAALLDQLAGERRHHLVVGVGLVGLQHRELRRVRAVGALVAEVPVDLEHPVEPADDAPLQEQLRRDAQVQVEVEGIHVGAERPGGRSAVHRLQHRRLDLEESTGVQPGAQGRHHGGPLADGAAGLVAHDQVHIAAADPQFLAHRLVRHRQRAQRLGGQLPGVGEDRELAAARRPDLAGDQDVVAEVDVGLPGRQGLLADPVAGEHHLQLGVALAQGGEAELAGVAEEDDPAGDADLLAGHGVRLQVGVGGADGGQRGGPLDRHRVGVDARSPAAGRAWRGGPAAARGVRRRRRRGVLLSRAPSLRGGRTPSGGVLPFEGQPQPVDGQVGLPLADGPAAVDDERGQPAGGDDDRRGTELGDDLGGDAGDQPVDQSGEARAPARTGGRPRCSCRWPGWAR